MDRQPSPGGRLGHFSSYWEFDILATYECAQTMERRTVFYPEEKLMFAVMTEAILCFQLYGRSEKRHHRALFKQAESWIFNDESDSLYSFVSICEVLRINPHYLRRGLRKWRTEQRSYIKGRPKKLRHPYRIRNQHIYV